MPDKQRLSRAVFGPPKRLAGRFYQLETRNCLTRQYLQWTKNRATAKCGWPVQKADMGEPARGEAAAGNPVGEGSESGWKGGKNRFKIRDLFADERYTWSILVELGSERRGLELGLGA